jgi:hypoxanthine phosphoribosyltransferase
VLIVEDIIDSGLTINEIHRYIEGRGASLVKTVAFLDKPKARKSKFEAEYVGFSIDPQFVVGYGLDFAEKYRNVPEIQVLSD